MGAYRGGPRHERLPAYRLPLCGRYPRRLSHRLQWVNWRYEQRKGAAKPTKPPINPRINGKPDYAKTNDPATWTDLGAALTAARSHGLGIGFCLWEGDGLTGIDLDHVIDPGTGEINTEAAEIVERFKGTYCETSPSREGLRIWCYGKAQRSGKGAGDQKWVEIYTHPSHRFLTVTGHHWAGTATAITDCQAALDWLHETYMDSTGEEDKPPPVDKGKPSLDLDDAGLLAKARRARNGAEFERLFAGDLSAYQGDHSSADLALCSMLAFWTDRDAAKIDRLFRQSGLMRPKWDSKRGEATYGQMTIEKAIAGTRETYRGGKGGPEKLQGKTSAPTHGMDTAWDDPVPLPDGLPPVEPFVDEMLPAALRPWIMDIAERMQCPPDIRRGDGYCRSGALVGRKIGIYPKKHDDWLVVPNLWGGVVGRPGYAQDPRHCRGAEADQSPGGRGR